MNEPPITGTHPKRVHPRAPVSATAYCFGDFGKAAIIAKTLSPGGIGFYIDRRQVAENEIKVGHEFQIAIDLTGDGVDYAPVQVVNINPNVMFGDNPYLYLVSCRYQETSKALLRKITRHIESMITCYKQLLFHLSITPPNIHEVNRLQAEALIEEQDMKAVLTKVMEGLRNLKAEPN